MKKVFAGLMATLLFTSVVFAGGPTPTTPKTQAAKKEATCCKSNCTKNCPKPGTCTKPDCPCNH